MAITTSALDPYDPRNMLSGSIGQVDSMKELYDRMQRLELEAQQKNAARQQAATFNPDKYTLNLGRPCTVIHRLGNGLLVTDIGAHDGQLLKHMFFATALDYANHLIAETAKKELEK
jgi:hypothetical protein